MNLQNMVMSVPTILVDSSLGVYSLLKLKSCNNIVLKVIRSPFEVKSELSEILWPPPLEYVWWLPLAMSFP